MRIAKMLGGCLYCLKSLADIELEINNKKFAKKYAKTNFTSYKQNLAQFLRPLAKVLLCTAESQKESSEIYSRSANNKNAEEKQYIKPKIN